MDRELSRILHLASLAPSGHNTQPWRVVVHSGTHLTIGVDPARLLPVVDPGARETLLSIGAFCENLAQAALANGWETEIVARGDGPLASDLVEVSLERCAPVGDEAAIRSRRTVKSGYDGRKLSGGDEQALAEPWGGRLIYLPCSSKECALVADASVESFRKQTNNDDAQAELSEWVRFSRDDEERRRDGLTPDGMEMGLVASALARY